MTMPADDPQLNRGRDLLTVGQLREFLATLPADLPIVMSSDAEGNQHSPLATAMEEMYEATSTWSGATYATPEHSAWERAQPDGSEWTEEDDAPEGTVRVVSLYPTN